MNLEHIVNDQDILYRFRMVHTNNTLQPCFRCEQPITTPDHRRAQVSGASGHMIGIQICTDCYIVLHQEAWDRREHGNDRPHMAPLTEEERKIPAPVQLGTRFAPRAIPTEDPHGFF